MEVCKFENKGATFMIMDKMLIKNLYNLAHTAAAPLLEKLSYPWEALPKIGDFIVSLGETLSPDEYDKRGDDVWIAKSATVFDTAFINGPVIIGPNTEVRHCAFIRGSALVGAGCVVGNSVELKNVILFDGVQVPHYNYVGDSILGFKSHMGAGSITSNVKSDKTLVTVDADGDKVETGLKKFGAMLGDRVEVGCNSVLNPGTIIGKDCSVYPLSMVRGFIPARSIYKRLGEVVNKI
jgi:NDP-sugar pyrophosphorylase family protein